MKASDWINDFLHECGVRYIFGYIGGMVTHLVDSIQRSGKCGFVQTYHEQSAAFAAEGYARSSGIPGVAVATSGPGATNMLTGVADAYFDSVPVLYITGQVNTGEYKYAKPVRQQGFQETDVVSMAKPVTKYAVLVDRPERICFEFEKAWFTMIQGRPGPVLIDLPLDMQRADIDPATVEHFLPPPPEINESPETLAELAAAEIRSAQRPLLVVGNGARKCADGINQLVAQGIPAVCTLMGKGVIDEDLSLFCGVIGAYGRRCANLILGCADLLVVLGSRLTARSTGNMRDAFAAGKRIFWIDIDANELKHHRLSSGERHVGDVTRVVPLLSGGGKLQTPDESWHAVIRSLKNSYSVDAEIRRFIPEKFPYLAMRELSRLAPPDTVFIADVGQNQMWSAQCLDVGAKQEFLASGGMAPMGYAVPSAVGAAFACGGRRQVVAITGDGGLQISMQSLLLISQYSLPVVVVLMNNASLGMITQFQRLYFDGKFAGTTREGGYATPDFAALAQAFRLPYFTVSNEAELETVIKQALMSERGIVEVRLPELTVVSPKVEYNRSLYNMTPALPPEELAAALRVAPQVLGNENAL